MGQQLGSLTSEGGKLAAGTGPHIILHPEKAPAGDQVMVPGISSRFKGYVGVGY